MNFIEELKRRNVFRVGIAYVVIAWLIAQIADLVLDNIQSPDWVMQTILLLLAIGLPLALLFAWAFELTPDGIKKEKDVDRSQSIRTNTGRKLDLTIIGLLVIGLLYFVWESRFSEEEINTATQSDNTNSIAVLPFTNLAGANQGDTFVDGLHDDLLTQLSKLIDLKVVSRTSVLEYRDTTKNMRQIGLELGVKSLLEGGVQRAGDRVRLNVQLIDADTDEHIWAETYDRELTMDNIFEVQSEITRTIASALKIAMSDETAEQIAKAPTQDISIYELYQEIQEKSDNLSELQLEDFIDRLEQALVKDPKFALGFAQLSRLYIEHDWRVEKNSEMRTKALTNAQTALDLQANLIEAHVALAYYHYWGWLNYPAALDEIAKAKAINPNHADAIEVESYVLRRSGNIEGAVTALEKALELNPRSIDLMRALAQNYTYIRNFQKAGDMLDRMELLTSKDPSSYRNLDRPIYIKTHLGEIDVEQFLDFAKDAQLPRVVNIVFQFMTSGEYEKAITLINTHLNDKAIDSEVKNQLLWFRATSTFALHGLDIAKPYLLKEELKFDRKLLEDPNNIDDLISTIILNTLLGNGQKAKQYFDRLEPLIKAKNDYFAINFLELFRATSFGAAGEYDKAIDTLHIYYKMPMSESIKTTTNFPFLLWLKDHPRFQELVDANSLTTPGAEALYRKDNPKYRAQTSQ